MQYNEKNTRRDYDKGGISRHDLSPNPFQQMAQWMDAAKQANSLDATAMTLATVDETGQPSARVVLLKHFNDQGFCWYTNYASRKGQQLEKNPKAALSFYWRELSRQVQIEGTVKKLSATEADEYFHSRPLDSQISAAVSHQSQPVDSRQTMEQKAEQLKAQYKDQVPRPETWGGYLLVPHYFEFWQGRPNRLHDRFVYLLQDGAWEIQRLQP